MMVLTYSSSPSLGVLDLFSVVWCSSWVGTLVVDTDVDMVRKVCRRHPDDSRRCVVCRHVDLCSGFCEER